MIKNFINSALLVIICLLISCNPKPRLAKNERTKVTIKYAQGYEIALFDDYKKLIIKSPYPNSEHDLEYILVNENTNLSQFDESENLINTPVNKIVVTSTTHIPMLELLNKENTLIGFPNMEYVSSKKTRELIDSNKIQELGNDASLNTEMVIDLEPNMIMAFAMSSGNKSFSTIETAGIPVIYNGDWLENTPLGRAEWIRVFGTLYNEESKADSIFNQIESQYNSAIKEALNVNSTPSILSGAMFKDVWNLPAGESFVATFLRDANTNYLWKDTSGTGSLQLNFENVFEKGLNAHLWIAPGYFETKEQMLNSSPHYSQFEAFKKDEIYTFSTKKGTTGGVIYYELAPTRPDLVLKDIIKIAHPNLLKDYSLTFFEKMN